MESAKLCDEISAFREVLQKGSLTEIDLDALGDCLGETLRTLEEMKRDECGEKLFRSDVISEIVNLSRAAQALESGEPGIDSDSWAAKLASLDAEKLLAIRKRVRLSFSHLQRSEDAPRRRYGHTASPKSFADYKLENERV
ncbi:MAG: hypothetical protein KKG33_05460 [candidate division Zixibacteria bacterium]|nr:hypothetical protein [candidate division Zixibacteria bacterium]MBU1470705.1 hypothetical protein [candidate division Zixibacteria bacterium]MBU2624989.1 hypothetical protein [candidate division Zixibacteria bacterium]